MLFAMSTKEMEAKYVLGLDLGVASIGWGMLELDENDIPMKIIDQNVVIFKALDNDKGKLYNVDRRNQRGMRRTIRRRSEKLRILKKFLISEGIVNEQQLENMFHEKGVFQGQNPFDLKIKGIHKKLDEEELARILIHYIKNRGFRSNRKETSKEEKGKMKEAISDIQNIMKRDNVLVSQAVKTLQIEKKFDTLHNKEDSYNYGFERDDVLDEINKVLDKQIEFQVITEQFKEEYIKIWSSQRDYSEGPASGPYKVSFEKMFGFCKFRTGERRIAKSAPSFELFVMLQKLQNLRFFYLDEDGSKATENGKIIKASLTKEHIQKIYDVVTKSETNKTISYDYLKKLIGRDDVEFENMPQLSKREFNNLIVEYKKTNNIDAETVLNESQYAEVKKNAKKQQDKKEVFSLKFLYLLRNEVKKKSENKSFLKDIYLLDDIATILTYAKTDGAIESTIKNNYNEFTELEIELTKKINISASGSGKLSLSLVQDLIEIMLKGSSYDEAMAFLGYDHALYKNKTQFASTFPTISEIEEAYETSINQPNVKHVLVMLRKLYRTIGEKYGTPYYVHIEVAREIRNDFSTRMEIKNNQTQNQVSNQMAKVELAKIFGTDLLKARHYGNFSKDDIIKYRLWKEQNGACLYSGEEIALEQLLDRGTCEVDHILPFSRTFDDTYQNKVLVSKKENQDKRNRTPYEWMKSKNDGSWELFKERVSNNSYISYSKKDKLLLTEKISYEKFSEQSLHATAYVSKLAIKIFKDLLNEDDDLQRVKSFKGGATSYLRKYYQLNDLTHSLESKTYSRRDTEYFLTEDIKIKIDSKDKAKTSIEVNAINTYGDTLVYTVRVNYNKKEDKFYKIEDEELYQVLTSKGDELLEYIKDEDLYIMELNAISDATLMKGMASEDNRIPVLVYKLLQGLRAKQVEKNRGNHFHHIIDALLVASMTLSMQIKITKFHQLRQQLRTSSINQIEDEATGEIYTEESLLKVFNINSEVYKNPKYQIPLPYPEFINELKYRIFERNQDVLNDQMKTLSNYTSEEAELVNVKYPSFIVDKKVHGGLHAETIYGMKEENGKKVATIRRSINSLKEKDLENIFDKDNGQKEIYETLKEWMKDKSVPPILKNGNTIKKVKIKDANVEKFVEISPNSIQKGYAGIGSVARIEIYKKEVDDKLYFVQIPIDAYLKIQKNDFEFNVKVWWGQGDKNKLMPYSRLGDEYILYQRIYPGQIIGITLKSGAYSPCISTGFTSGKFEISSLLGDGIDLISTMVVRKILGQYQLTTSMIKSVEPVNVDILGNIVCHTDN